MTDTQENASIEKKVQVTVPLYYARFKCSMCTCTCTDSSQDHSCCGISIVHSVFKEMKKDIATECRKLFSGKLEVFKGQIFKNKGVHVIDTLTTGITIT